jgi:glutathione S-transferase
MEVQRDELKKSPHIDRSPFGLMPYLVDTENGKVVFESRAICRCEYAKPTELKSDIASKVHSLLLVNPPADFGDAGQLDRWTRFEEACSIESTIWDVPVYGLAKELKMKKECVEQGHSN